MEYPIQMTILRIITLVCLMILPGQGWAAVAADGEAIITGTTSGTTDLTLDSKTTAGSGRIGFACYSWIDQSVSLSSSTWNGVGMTLVDTSAESASLGMRASLYYILDPPTGASSVVGHWSASISSARGVAFSVNGADTGGTPFGTAVTVNTTGWTAPPATVTVTTASGELVVDCLSWSQSDVTPPSVGANQTAFNIGGFYTSDSVFNAASWQNGSDGGVMSWTFGGSGIGAWGFVAVPVKPSAGAAASFKGMMMVGAGQ